MRFTRHYAGAPVCAPSRCVLMTGRHLSKAYIRNNRELKPEGQAPIPSPGTTVADIMRRAGYATGAFGKWGLGFVGTSSDPAALGFDEFFGYNCQREAHSFYPGHLWHNTDKIVINEPAIPGHHRGAVPGNFDFSTFHGQNYAPELIRDAALTFIREQAGTGTPFFAYLPFVEPHLAMHPPQEWVDQYPTDWDPPRASYKAQYLPHPRPRAGYAAMISHLDDHVGQVLALLDELGLRDNTLVIFTSDNGPTHCVEVDVAFFNSAGGLRGDKGRVYEGGLRVPMLARWPGRIQAGSSTDHVSGFQDVLATLCALTDQPLPEVSDGVSFLPSLLGTPQPPQPVLAWEFQGYGGQQAIILDGRWKGVRGGLHRKKSGGPLSAWEVYDLTTDPSETTDLAAERPDLVARIDAAMTANRNDDSPFLLNCLPAAPTP
jgi:arylsulfatase